MQSVTTDPEISYLKEYFLVFLVSLPNMLCGFVTGYATMTLPLMDLTLSDASWFSTINTFSAPIGSILLETLTDTIGRKKSLLIGISTHIVGWSLLSWDFDTTSSFTGCFLIGFLRNSMTFPGHMYAAECLTIKNRFQRNSLSTWTGITAAVGMFSITLLSFYCSYQRICVGVAIFATVLFIIIAVWLPESPVWLKKQGRVEEVDRSEKKLGFSQPNFDQLKDSKADKPKRFHWSWWTKNVQKLKRKDVYKPTIIITIADMILVLSGYTAMANYEVFIIGSHPHGIDPNSEKYLAYMCSLFSAALQLLAHILTTLLMLKISARLIMMSSCVLVAFSISVLGFAMSGTGPTSVICESVAIGLNIFAHSLGIYLTPIALMGGTFPRDALGFASVPVVAVGVASGVLVQVHPYLVENVGNTLYYIYGGLSLLGGFFVLIFFSEISGKTANSSKIDSNHNTQSADAHGGFYHI